MKRIYRLITVILFTTFLLNSEHVKAQWFINLSGDLQTDVTWSTYTSGNALINNNLTVGHNLTVTNNVSIASNLTALTATFANSLTVTNSITTATVTATAAVTTPSLTATDGTIGNNLGVGNAITTTSLTATTAITTSSVTATDATITNNADVGNAITTASLTATTAITTASVTATNATITNNMGVTNAITTASLTATTAVTTPSVTATNATITNNVDVGNAITTASLTATTAITTPSVTATDATITNNVDVGNAITTASLTATSATITTITSSSTVTSAITTPTLTATNATITNNLTVYNKVGIGMAPTTADALAITGDMTVNGNTNINGDENVAGKISLGMPGDPHFRQIEGQSDNYGLDIATGFFSAADPGTSIHMTSPVSTVSGVPLGLMQFKAGGPFHATSTSSAYGMAYDFLVPLTVSGTFSDAVVIDNIGNTRLGQYGLPLTDRLTVDGDIFINTRSNTDVFRNVYAKSLTAGLNMTSGAVTDGSDGACLTQIAKSCTTSVTPGFGIPTPGASIFKSYASGANFRLTFAFQNWEPTGSTPGVHNAFLIDNNAQGIYGHDVALNNITGADVLTVKSSLGFYSPTDNFRDREVHGNSTTGSLNLYSNNNSSTGSGLELFAQNHATWPGQMHMITKGTTGVGAYIENFDGSTWHYNVTVSNAGQTLIGHDMDLPLAVAGDVLTVKDQMGFYDVSDAARRAMDGNTNTGLLTMSAKTNSTDGSAIELYGAGHGTFPAQIHYVSKGTTGLGHEFSAYNGTTWLPSMRIYNNADVQTGSNISMDIRGDGQRNIFGNSTTGWLGLCSGHGGGAGADGAYVQLFANGSVGAGSALIVSTGTGSGTSFIYEPPTGSAKTNMTVYNGGQVVIAGPGHNVADFAIPGSYGLYVGEGILTEKVKVASHTGTVWSDFVFDKEYKLMPISDVNDYIQENKHLPGIPTTEDVIKNGIDLAVMDAKLLQKVEELTLYVIEQQKRIEVLEYSLKTKRALKKHKN